MQLLNMYLPGFNHGFGRKPKSSQKRFADKIKALRESLPTQLPELFIDILPTQCFPRSTGQRKRVFDLLSTFWLNLDQIFNAGTLRWANRQMQFSRIKKEKSAISTDTGAYCKARQRVGLDWIKSVHQHICKQCVDEVNRVLLVDGTSVQLLDSKANQDAYPQSGEQKPGCGMPIVQLIGLFEAESGMLVDFEDSPWSVHENALFQGLMLNKVHQGDLLIADRAYCSFYNFHYLQDVGANTVMRLHQARKVSFPKGENDMLVQWNRPTRSARPEYIDEDQWAALPQSITVRYVRYRIEEKGFRTQEIVLVTTLLDVPVEELAELYAKRWQIELSFRDVKTTMKMELIAVKSPDLALKQIWMFVIAHNLIRHLINRTRTAVKAVGQKLLSFKGTLDTLITFARSRSKSLSGCASMNLVPIFSLIAADPVPFRPGRVEPRCVKRRPKGYQLMTSPRHLMIVSASRSQK